MHDFYTIMSNYIMHMTNCNYSEANTPYSNNFTLRSWRGRGWYVYDDCTLEIGVSRSEPHTNYHYEKIAVVYV